jgi:Amt family ammonium transporter
MINRFIEKLKDPQERKLFIAILGGKAIGLGLCILLMFAVSFYFSSTSKVHAQTASPSASAETATQAPSPAAANAAAPAPAPAAAPAPAPNPPYVNPINTMWVLVTAFLVFFMQAGFMFLEAGFARTRESVNVMLEGIVDTSLCGLLFYLWGFAWMFGHGNGSSAGAMATAITGSACKTFQTPMNRRASRRSRYFSFSSHLPIPARRSPLAQW